MFSYAFAFIFSAHVAAQENVIYDASGDYIKDCKHSTCAGLAALRWSKSHPFAVAVAVRMGTKPAVTDDQIKMVLTRDFANHGVKEIKFFYEYHDAVASVMTLHVRGGTEGGFVISDVRQEVEGIAERARNQNPATITGS
ncbi:MAG: hypothetical protein ABJD02_09640 [Paraglaciecola sp.]|uniref:hypothetical protein n=1 Tax=Paraglaciecola sp. TaxID=1920173 RepID=UPI0032652B1E